MHLKFKNLIMDIKAVDQAKYTIRAVFSTNVEDRHGEIVNQNGWNLVEYMLNPVVLYQHDMSLPPIGKIIELGLNTEGQLEGTVQYAVEENPFAKVIYNLYVGKYMRAFSAGFRNDEYSIDQQNETVILMRNTLYEISAVSVPANYLALAKSKGIDTSAVEAYQLKHAKKVDIIPEDTTKPEPQVDVVDPKPEEKPLDTKEQADGKLKTLKEAQKMLNELISSAEQISTDNQGDLQSKVASPSHNGPKRFKKSLINTVIRKLHTSKHVL